MTVKIVHIASGDLWAGAEVQLWTLLCELVKQHQVCAILLNEGRLADELRKVGVDVVIISEQTYGFFALIKQIAAQLRVWQPDIVHTHRQKENIVGSLANAASARAASVRTVHGAPEYSPSKKQQIQIALDTWCGKYLQQAVIAVSDTLKTLLDMRFGASRVVMITNGISAKAVRAQAKQDKVSTSPNGRHVGLVGRMTQVKRVDLFIGMAAEVRKRLGDSAPIHYHIFGDGELASSLQQQAKAVGMDNLIAFHGHTDKIRGWIRAMDVLVMPSDHEGLPMTALESLSVGTPLIAHATGGLVPLLGKAFPAGLVEAHTVNGYADALINVLSSANTVSLPTEYEASENARQVTALYNSLIS